MAMKINFVEMKGFKSSEATSAMSMDSSLRLGFYVNKADGTQELACTIQLKDLALGFSAIIDSMVLRPKVLSADLTTVVQEFSTFGDINIPQITSLFQQILTITLPSINDAINSFTLTIPNKVFGLIGLSQLELVVHDNYIEGLLMPTFIAPTTLGEFEKPL